MHAIEASSEFRKINPLMLPKTDVLLSLHVNASSFILTKTQFDKIVPVTSFKTENKPGKTKSVRLIASVTQKHRPAPTVFS